MLFDSLSGMCLSKFMPYNLNLLYDVSNGIVSNNSKKAGEQDSSWDFAILGKGGKFFYLSIQPWLFDTQKNWKRRILWDQTKKLNFQSRN